MEKILPIFLSAGLGTRLSKKNNRIPKSLIKIHSKPLIFFQLEKLSKLGIKEVLIIVGFESIKVKNTIGSFFEGMKIHYVSNDCFESSGTAYSFFKAKDFWKKEKLSILMLHADLFYDTDILEDVLKIDQESVLVTDYKYERITNDEMIVFANGSSVSKVVKGPKNFKNSIGESLGINLYTSDFSTRYFNYLEKFFTSNKRKKFHWEQTIEGFLQTENCNSLTHIGIDSKPWININYQDDLDYAANNIYHKLYNSVSLH